ncbi:MAG: hypothetical protein A2V66_00160 [Ignavibacteria bacterium RBG_13_36_8]|nr:MAG: hypothetical protein A2V66_00160 [Ignavibacteria bacterium RBG_13_36_8]
MKELEIKIEGMSCQHCVMAVKKELSKLKLDSIYIEIGKLKVKFDETLIKDSQIAVAIEEAGYKVAEQ